MRSIDWLLLDNLASGWPYSANLSQANADDALRWVTSQGFVRDDGTLTPEGRGYFLAHRHSTLTQ